MGKNRGRFLFFYRSIKRNVRKMAKKMNKYNQNVPLVLIVGKMQFPTRSSILHPPTAQHQNLEN